MSDNKEYADFHAELEKNRADVKSRRDAVRAKYGKAVSPNRLKVLRLQAKERKKALKKGES